MKTEISIIIPLYNAENYIEETLKSLVDQSFVKWECFVIDDGSTDNSFIVASKFLEEDNRIKVLKRPDDIVKGPSGIRNYGIKISNSKYIHFLDADDIFHPEKLKLQFDILEKDKTKIACISTSYHFKGSINNLTRPWKKEKLNGNGLDGFGQSKAGWCTNDPLWRKKLLPEKMFDERLFGPDDWAAHINILINNKIENIFFLDKILCYIRVLPVSLHTEPSKRRLKSDVLSRILVLRWFSKINISEETTKKLTKDLLISSEEALKFGHLRLGVKGLIFASKQLFKLGFFIKPFKAFFIGLPSMYFFKKGYKYFR